MVTTEQIQFFDDYGYLPYSKVIEPEDIQELREGGHVRSWGGDGRIPAGGYR
jgi:hypothetical protein